MLFPRRSPAKMTQQIVVSKLLDLDLKELSSCSAYVLRSIKQRDVRSVGIATKNETASKEENSYQFTRPTIPPLRLRRRRQKGKDGSLMQILTAGKRGSNVEECRWNNVNAYDRLSVELMGRSTYGVSIEQRM